MMGGVVLTEINVTNIFCYMVLVVVLYLKASKEEKLWSEKLEEYKQYKKHTKMFIPFVL
jgi:protein-S-isoprenylcysteine O-methyltransferase Ste14